ncbi:hypothetical protein SLS62_001660 [Diatrype stigma]|uniref:Heterokaryon incompatibility domain-containing protein n=1 Tax=Diatrype stigma TaxID=117547 RepID=A0AAN9V8C8_9PEZI
MCQLGDSHDTIYAKAEPVLAWLGPASDDSELAMATLGASRLREQAELAEEVEVACDAVVRLFSRPYFRHTWILQEICRARSPVVVCGRRWVLWGTLLKRVDLFRFRADTETGLIPLLVASRRSLARDPRDKLYALLSLARDGRVLVPTPNYSQTTEEVFWDTARSMIAGHDRTDVILLAHRTRGERELPSWVSDWANLRCKPPPWILEALAENCSLLRPPNRRNLRAYSWRCIMQVLYQLCCKEAAETSATPKLANWIWHNRGRTVGCCTLQQHIEAYLSKSITDDLNVGENDDLELVLSALGGGFERFERFRMIFAITKNGDLCAVYRAAGKGDQIYILKNCSLPVILRDTGHGSFRFVGEVFVSQDSPFIDNKRQPEIVLIE